MQSRHELLTPRLRLRRWRDDDEPLMAAINRDPEVTRYLNRPFDEPALRAFYGLVLDHWDEHGFGFHAVELRRPGERDRFIGFVGPAYPTFLPELATRPELGWRLAHAVWGQGLATEAAKAARDDAFGRLRLAELISIIHPENARSRRVAAKLGMSIDHQVQSPILGRGVDVWHVRRPDSPAST